MKHEAKGHFGIEFINTSGYALDPGEQRNVIDYIFKAFVSAKVIGLGCFKAIRFKAKHLKHDNKLVAHITTSGGIAFAKDLITCFALKMTGAKVIMHLHFGDIRKNQLLIKLKPIASIVIGTFICLSRKDAHELKAIYPNTKIKIVYNGVSLYSKPKQKAEGGEFIFIGRVEKAKGIVELLEAFTSEYAQNEKLKLRIIGKHSGSLKGKEFIAKLEKTKNVEYLGELDKGATLKLLEKSSCLILPSYSEGMPYVILEAMNKHVLVLATTVGGITDQLGQEYPFYIEELSSRGIIKTIKKYKNFSAKLIDEQIKINYSRQQNYFTSRSMFERTKKIWEAC